MNTVDKLAALIREVDGDHSLGAGELAEKLVEGGWRFTDGTEPADIWLGGWYHATNGKWGPPEKGENPYGDTEDDE